MHPRELSLEEWEKVTDEYTIDKKSWDKIDGLKKIYLLKSSGVDISRFFPTFGEFTNIRYPNDIFMFSNYKNKPLTLRTLSFLRGKAKTEGKEIGGIINDGDYKIMFTGNENRINLDVDNVSTINQTLFHTHIEEENIYIDPPSVLDIVNFLCLNVKYIVDYVLNNDIGKEFNSILKIKNCVIFTHNEIYVYYISIQLFKEISRKIMSFVDSEDFIAEVEKIMENVELSYSNYLQRFNIRFDESILEQYLKTLLNLGIIVKRYDYTNYDKIELFS